MRLSCSWSTSKPLQTRAETYMNANTEALEEETGHDKNNNPELAAQDQNISSQKFNKSRGAEANDKLCSKKCYQINNCIKTESTVRWLFL